MYFFESSTSANISASSTPFTTYLQPNPEGAGDPTNTGQTLKVMNKIYGVSACFYRSPGRNRNQAEKAGNLRDF